jgi:hypothetical protein
LRIGLIDVDGHNFPNLALMKISAHHKKRGDDVEWWWGFGKYDRVYMSKVFDETYSVDMAEPYNAREVIKGGTGYGLNNKLPEEIEHEMPDYSIYYDILPKSRNTAYGFLTRGCPRGCEFCIVAEKEGRKSVRVAPLREWWNGQKNIKLLDPNTLACKEHLEIIKELADSGAWVDFTQGIDARLLTDENIYALNAVKTKMLHFAWDLPEQSDRVLRGLELYSKLGKMGMRERRVYVLTNFNTTTEQDLYRIYKLKEMEFDPYVMIFDKPKAPRVTRLLQRWVNNKIIFRTCEKFEDFDPRKG